MKTDRITIVANSKTDYIRLHYIRLHYIRLHWIQNITLDYITLQVPFTTASRKALEDAAATK